MYKISKSNLTTITSRTVNQIRLTNEKINLKIKGTVFETWLKFWKTVIRDYSDVALSVKKDIKEKPGKAALTFTGLGFLSLCALKNPDKASFRAKYVQCSNDLSLVALSVANPEAVEHLKYIEQCYNASLLRYRSFGFFSVVWVDKYSSDCDVYESNCKYLKVPYRKLTERILDVGFLDIWWVISRKMLDYDINTTL